ncbi:hypothetical protein FB45DRAFT_1053050 [Roridomyces roridus]|uniref:Uncharacterized protein n=1 Tax=Roridomyces roridus TaxID=1738132 RepID=A0AAD7CB78_9AGAR|nr:hypothetical protein FB45DRAFT_1053050 [Roridomyces roridus]
MKRSTAFPIHPPTPEFLRLEGSIRALSTAIYRIQAQCEFSGPPSSDTIASVDEERAIVYGQISTLLTTGVGSLVGRQQIAVTGGSSHRGFFINVTEVVACHSDTFLEPAVVQLSQCLPSQKTLKQLAEDRRPLSDITLAEHAGDVLQALHLISQDIYAKDRRLLECFIARRCHPEISRRLNCAVSLLDPPLHEVLNKWELHPNDHLREDWIVIPYPLILLESFCIPHRPSTRWPDRRELLFNRQTFGVWKKFFVSLLQVVSSTVAAFEPEQTESAADLVLALHFLRLFFSFGPARTMLGIASLRPILLQSLSPEHQVDLLTIVDHELQVKSPVDIICRTWAAVVAYDVAITSLVSRHSAALFILRHSVPSVHIIHAPSRKTSKIMDSIPRIMHTKVLPALKLNKHHADVVEALISEHLTVADFPGHVHCEAALMGVAYVFSSEDRPVKESVSWAKNLPAFYDAFEGHSNAIGHDGDQSCQICSWLSEELLLSNGHFTLQGSSRSSAKTIPWSPPRFGIPLHILRNLESELLDLLIDSTQGWLQQKTRGI